MHCWDCIKSCRNFYSSFIFEMLLLVIAQPVLVLFINFVIPNNIFLMSVTIGILLITLISLAKHELRSHLLYCWIVLSMTFTFFVFELLIVPLAEISSRENCFLVLYAVISLYFLYLTSASNKNKFVCNGDTGENGNWEAFTNGSSYVSICPVCRVKMLPRNYHCNICQECMPKYDHHSYWLNCCISEINLHYYVAGIFFGVFALAYVSLLILTTVCSPDFKFGILLPEDCTYVGENIETCTGLVCGIYCMELAALLLFKVLHHSYLISKGLSLFEWQEKYRYSLCCNSPYSSGFLRNWVNFFSKFKKINL